MIKSEEDRQLSIRPSTVYALRLIATGATYSEAASKIGRAHSNLLGTVKRLKRDFPAMCKLIDEIRDEGFLEKTSKRERRKKLIEARIRLAKKGIYLGPVPFGAKRKGNTIVWIKGKSDIVRKLYHGILEGEQSRASLARQFRLKLSAVYAILRNRIYKGELVILEEIYKGNWKPLIDPAIWYEVQKKFAPGPGKNLFFGYRWQDGKKILKPWAKAKYETMFKMRLDKENPKGHNEIGKAVGLSGRHVMKLMSSRRITGKEEINGRLVDSGYPPAIDEETWKAAQEVIIRGNQKMAKQARELRKKIMGYLPAFRWQLMEKLKVGRHAVEGNVVKLKEEGYLKERDDGLLQRVWEPFPKRLVETRRKSISLLRRKIISVLGSCEKTTTEIISELSLSKQVALNNLNRLEDDGFVEIIRPQHKQDRRGKFMGFKWRIRTE